ESVRRCQEVEWSPLSWLTGAQQRVAQVSPKLLLRGSPPSVSRPGGGQNGEYWPGARQGEVPAGERRSPPLVSGRPGGWRAGRSAGPRGNCAGSLTLGLGRSSTLKCPQNSTLALGGTRDGKGMETLAPGSFTGRRHGAVGDVRGALGG